MIGPTIYQYQKIFMQKEKLNGFLDTRLSKVLNKGGTKGKLLKDWRPITLLSQIYKLISGVLVTVLMLLDDTTRLRSQRPTLKTTPARFV